MKRMEMIKKKETLPKDALSQMLLGELSVNG